MKNISKKIPIWLLMAWPYIFLGGLFVGGASFFGIFCICTFVLCVANVVNVWKYQSDNIAKDFGFWGMVIKLVHMPFYVVAFVMGLLGIVSMAANTVTDGSPLTLLFMFIMSMLLMLQSSLYSAKAVLVGAEMKIVKKESAMLYAITSFIMFVDVICAILIYSKIKK